MFESRFDIPSFIAALVIVGTLCLFAIGGVLLRGDNGNAH